jgi:phosphohistidine phosphatase
MNLYIMRHANAGTPRENATLDRKRGLIKEGKEQCLQVAGVLNALNLQFDLVASSPLKRALQTAQLVATEVGYEQPMLVTEALSPEAKTADFERLIEEYKLMENVLLVGHNPNLQAFLTQLIAREGKANVRLRKAGVARVDLSRRPSTLNWLLDPRMVRALYRSATKSSRRKTSRK